MADTPLIETEDTPAHTDHATWASFTNEEFDGLREILALAKTNPEFADKAEALTARLDQYSDPATKDERYREAARELNFVNDGECEVDDHGVVSWSDEGAYVMAWVWVDRSAVEGKQPDEEAEIDVPGQMIKDLERWAALSRADGQI